MVFGPNDATLGLSTGHSGNGPWSGVAGVAVAPIMSELIESYAIFNVFLCYTLYTPIAMAGWRGKVSRSIESHLVVCRGHQWSRIYHQLWSCPLVPERANIDVAQILRSFHFLNTRFDCARETTHFHPHLQSNYSSLDSKSVRNIICVLFVFGSGDQTTFSFNASPILRRQEGLYIVNALPWRKGCLARGTRHEFGSLYLFVAVHVTRAIAKNLAHSHPNY
jgi:hypothetical protein